MLEELKQAVCEANIRLSREGLVFQTFGNASGIDAERKHVVIKPSGVPYDALTPEQMVVVALDGGDVVEGKLKASSDTPTHVALYRAFHRIGGVVHTHSLFATAWAQARQEIPVLGTTHADFSHGPVPCTRALRAEEVEREYEGNIGKVIVERFAELDPLHFPGVLVVGHGPFAWGPTPEDAVSAAVELEYIAHLTSETLRVDPNAVPLPDVLLDRHFLRKHGPGATYGQEGKQPAS